jgi:hypothetical protein
VSLTFNSSPSGPSDPTYPYYSTSGVYINKGTLLPCAALNSITVSGGVSVHISATSGCNYTIANGINNGGKLLQVDNAAGGWYVNGGITTNGGSTLTTPLIYQIGPKTSAKSGWSCSICEKRCISGCSLVSGMVGIRS